MNVTTFSRPVQVANKGTHQVKIGQRIYCILHGGTNGVIYAINGTQRPATIQSLGGIVCMGGNAYFEVVFEDGTKASVPEAIVRGSQWTIYEEIATADEILDLLDIAKQAAEQRKLDAEAKVIRLQKEREEAKANNPHLVPGDEAAKNIRRDLKRHFPGVKFSVRKDGSSIDVRWDCGPTTKQVTAITGRYEYGSFDGMTDCYDHHDNPFSDVFGGVRYVMEKRSFGANEDEVFAKCKQDLRAFFADRPEYQIGDILWRVLGKSPLGKTLSGIRRVEGVTCGLAEDFYEAY